MKIVCDSCGAKYSIADEKVAGKVFKIRCKKCSSVIVVRGDQVAAEGQEQQAAPEGYDYSGDAIWHVVIGGEQAGPYAPAQIGGLLSEGTIDWDAYVWREGFEGWIPARDVPELIEAVTGQPPPDAGAEQPAAGAAAGFDQAQAGLGGAAMGAGAMGADPFGGGADMGAEQQPADAFGAAAPAAAAQEPAQPFDGGGALDGAAPQAGALGGNDAFGAPPGADGGVVAQRATHDAGADLFAQAEAQASPFGSGGEDEDVVASAPGPRVSADQASMTGQRNENSVLFSLQNLQALATGSGGGGGGEASQPPPQQQPQPGHAAGEGSGLIDIRALATATAAVDEQKAQSGQGNNVDDLLSIGGGGGVGTSLGAPVLAPAAEPEKNKKPLIIGAAVGGGVLALGAIIAIVALVTSSEPEPVASAAGQPTETGTAAGTTGTGGSGSASGEGSGSGGDEGSGSDEAAAAVDSADEAGSSDDGDDSAPSEEDKADKGSSSSGSASAAARRRRARRQRGSSSSSSGSSSGSSSSSSSSSSSGSSSSGSSGSSSSSRGGDDIDSLLDNALGGGGKKKSSGSSGGGGGGGGSNLPDAPPKAKVRSALNGVRSKVQACANGESGVAMAAVTVSGSSGRVSNVDVSGSGLSASVRSCIARAVRSARFPRFKRSTFSVKFPYRL